jgi:hypothetical protein
MQRTIRILVVAGTPLLALGLFYLDFETAFICYDMCPPESALAATIAARIADGAPVALICAVPVALAWVLCLVQLARAQRRRELAALTLALPCAVALSLFLLYVRTSGQLLPTTWLVHNAGWDTTFVTSLGVVLLWPVAIFIATFALRRR